MTDENQNDETGVTVERTDEQGQPLVEQQPQVTVEHREGEPDPIPVRVHLPALLSDEFGVSQSVAREQIALGMVTIDDIEIERGKIDFDANDLDGKVIDVQGRDRSFRVNFSKDRHLSRKDFR